jgi:hypothetical protein
MRVLAISALAVLAAPALADPAEIVGVEAAPGPGGWRFDVTLRHADTGWDDYADGWRVELPDGTVLATRELLHPHVEEQPFTRALLGVSVPAFTVEIVVRARTNVDGWGDTTVALPLAWGG